eukprot:767771-Prymnesium_polylepis.1
MRPHITPCAPHLSGLARRRHVDVGARPPRRRARVLPPRDGGAAAERLAAAGVGSLRGGTSYPVRSHALSMSVRNATAT